MRVIVGGAREQLKRLNIKNQPHLSVVVDQVEQPHELVMFALNYHIALHGTHFDSSYLRTSPQNSSSSPEALNKMFTFDLF